jgi:protein-L-isoaspartate(D-aspartate) O-methyltransferase
MAIGVLRAWLGVLLLLAGGALGAQAGPADQAARDEMVRITEFEVMMLSGATGIEAIDPPILAAMRAVPRHEFLPGPLQPYAYRNHPLPIGHDQNIAAPLLIALMTQLAALKPGDVVFETGTGEGYHAAILARLAAKVYSVEVIEPLAEQATATLARLHFDNVFVQAADGYYGWPEHGPYDAIIIKEAIDHVPTPLLRQLKRGGRLVMPLGPADGPQNLTVITKDTDGGVHERHVMPVRFSPLQGGERL